MAAQNEQLIVNLGARLTNLEQQMRKAGQLADDAVKDIEGRFERANPKLGALSSFAGGLAGGLLGAGALEKLIQSFRDANQELIKLGDTAKLTGQSIEELSRIQAAGRAQGVSNDDINKGVRGLAERLNEARREENDLTKLLEANNIAYKNREGAVISVNQALEIAARLIQNAATELDKVTIAKQLGLTEQWVKLLENGPQAFRDMQAAAEAAGATISRETVEKAREFEKAWAAAWESFSTTSKAVLSDLGTAMSFLISRASEFLKGLNELQNYRVTAQGTAGMVWVEDPNNPNGGPPGTTPRQVYNEPIGPNMPTGYRASTRSGPTTVIPPSGRNNGGGNEGLSDAEKAQARLEKYIEGLMRQEAVEKAIAETVGQSRAAQQAAIEIAKAQVDLSKLDEETRKRITGELAAQVKRLEEQREATRQLQQTQQAYNQLLQFAGNSAIDALDRMIVGGQSFGQVVGDITRQLARMLLQAALLGQGPLAQLLGIGGTGGGVGGLIGSLISGFRADGGPVMAGRNYVVGERGPEIFSPSTSGTIIPNDVARRGGGASVSFGDTIIDARGSQMSERQLRAILAEERAKTLSQVPDAVKQAQQNRRL